VADGDAFSGLLLKAGFASGNVTRLKNEEASRDAILAAIRRVLIDDVQPGDVRVFYYSGHGSQQVNSLSHERDKLDETLVPADSVQGARDIRDKEIGKILDESLDRGAVLTAIFDSCNSGSITRGPQDDGARIRALPPDLRDAADPSEPVPPEERGALIFAAAQDNESARELKDRNRGAFTAALEEALGRPGAENEPASRVLLRVRALIQKYSTQIPVLKGSLQRQRATLFDAQPAVIDEQAVVTVHPAESGFRVDAGTALGLGVLSRLTKSQDATHGKVVLEVSEVDGLGHASAKLLDGRTEDVADGDTFTVTSWAPPPGFGLLVSLPPEVDDARFNELTAQIRRLRASNAVTWVEDPAARPSATHVLEWVASPSPDLKVERWLWRLTGPDGRSSLFDSVPPAQAFAAKGEHPARLTTKPRVYSELPLPHSLHAALRKEWKPGARVQAVFEKAGPQYRVSGRLLNGAAAFALVRAMSPKNPLSARMPERTDFYAAKPDGSVAAALISDAARLARSYGWLSLRSKPEDDSRFPWRLALYNTASHELVSGDGASVRGSEIYGLALQADAKALQRTDIEPRWVYVFSLDSAGRRTLLWPTRSGGDVENFVPGRGEERKETIVLTERLFRIDPPFGTDTYFLLASTTKLPDTSLLDEEAVRTRGSRSGGIDALPLDLLGSITQRTRAASLLPQPEHWTIAQLPVRSEAGK
jgi:hypothetical protein